MRIADINQDSYPDISLTPQFKDSRTGEIITITGVMVNTPSNITDSERVMVPPPKDSYFDELTAIAGATGQLVTYVDVDEDGRLDFILQKMNSTTQLPELIVLYNNVVTDSFFVKAYMINNF